MKGNFFVHDIFSLNSCSHSGIKIKVWEASVPHKVDLSIVSSQHGSWLPPERVIPERARPCNVSKVEDAGLSVLKPRKSQHTIKLVALVKEQNTCEVSWALSTGLQPIASVYQKESLHPTLKPDHTPKESSSGKPGDIWVLKCRKCLSSFLFVAVLKYSLDRKTLVSSIQSGQPFSRFCLPLVHGVGGLLMCLFVVCYEDQHFALECFACIK